jgi:uncharacterized membrane protein
MSFVDAYFLQPIRVESGYNVVNTVSYAIMAFVLLYGIFSVFKYAKIKIDFKLFFSLLPFVFIGSSLRAIVDHGQIARSFWTVSPGIYLFATGLFLLSVFVSLVIVPRWRSKFVFSIGMVLLVGLWISYVSSLANVLLATKIMFLVSGLAIVLYLIFSKLGWSWATNKFAFSAFFAHLFDAVVTAMILFFVGGWEKHPLPRLFIENFGPFSFIPLKLVVIIPALYIISNEVEDKQFRKYILISIAVLGLGEGLRNLISLVV